ncbi:MAG: D-alanine--D-alanine ligase [Gemmatimonadales bacterium]|nr:D-alanine--D-alanine ligase [Gemmatimonadales bacterium]NIN10458.1 D-alanine--D-alanine ligase [Gemmatimonadales bacterium]NIN49250.1 D-alanine--D-alanine ligase [Gemmatimonadales bacterium]NIP06714.1 D-alanine--D-alanine ligase [Gemmatimonadales bacterium]NIR00045.1 D-alanine--D-alanine ligase [Gemmatimonadales bacterium]
MRVTVLTGGSTPERDVALAGAAQVVAALRAREHDVTVVDTVDGTLSPQQETERLVSAVGKAPPKHEELALLAERERSLDLRSVPALRDTDVIFPVLHGRQGEGGEIQTLLESAGLPYAGSGPLGSALAMDKDVAKRLFRDAKIPTPPWCVWPAAPDDISAVGFPLVVKPSKVGSTVGLTIVRQPDQLGAAVQEALAFDDEVILEMYATGREFTVGVLGDKALAVGEIIPSHEVFDYECKYTPGMTQEIFPADIPATLEAELQNLALRAHRALKLRDFSRADFRQDAEGTPHCLEVNTLPGLTATSLLPQSAAAVGIPFDELCDQICRLVLQRPRARNKVRTSGM